MKILVTNPTGKIGRRLVPELLAPEFSVRVIVRDPAGLPEKIREHVEVICGSSDDVATLRQALAGVEALLWCVPPESARETNVAGHYERFARAGRQAIRDARTPRVVTISAAGKGLARDAGPLSGLHSMEEILNESGAVLRHVRCGLFMEHFLAQVRSIRALGLISYPMPGRLPIPMTAMIDAADVALRWLVRRDWRGMEGVAVHGPADLSYEQAAAVLEQILGRPVRYREASPEAYVRTLVKSGASDGYARSRIKMFSALAQGITGAQSRTADSTTTTSFAAWAENELVPLAEAFPQPRETSPGWLPSPSPAAHPNRHPINSRSRYERQTPRTPRT